MPYVMGQAEDKVEKTPEWAAAICGVSANRIRQLARLMAKNRTQLIFGWSIQRQQHGEQPYWMAAVLAAMLGQIGLPGGGISYAHHYSSAVSYTHLDVYKRQACVGSDPGPSMFGRCRLGGHPC